MTDFPTPSRRLFLKSTAAAMLASPTFSAFGAEDDSYSLKDRLYKTLKIGMVKVDGSLTDKFNAAKAAGFAAIEMNAPGMDIAETKKAIAESGLPVDGTVNSTHWQGTALGSRSGSASQSSSKA